MQKHLGKNKKALSSLSLIILLLIAAIIGGIISYLWVTGYYVSLKQKIPEQDTVAITNLSFNPQNATAFNVTVLNPSYSPNDKIRVTAIAYTGQNETALHFVRISVPTLSIPLDLSRGTSQTFVCTGDLTPYVNQTLTVSVFVVNGSGSTNFMKIPYTALSVAQVDFNSTRGVSNFTITLRNNPLSATYLNITEISLSFTPPINFTSRLQPSLPFTLFPNSSRTFLCNYNWLNESRSGGSYILSVKTKQGYVATFPAQIPKLGFTIQQISFNAADTTHFNVTVKNQVSTNTYLNVTRVQVLLDNGTKMNVTTPLSPSTNGVLGNQTRTFKCAWNWTNYRNKNVIATVYVLQGINATGQQFTPPAGLLTISTAMPPIFPDTQHVLITVQNSPYSTRPANVTMIQVQLENGTLKTISGVYPSLPRLVEIGNTTMFSISWNWANYLGKTVDIIISTSEGYSTFKAVTTPSTTSNYQVYLSISSAIFNQTANFYVNVTNSASSVESANVTRITILLENGTEINATLTTQMVSIDSTATFTCGWDWSTYRNKSLVIRVYTNYGLKAIYVTKTPS